MAKKNSRKKNTASNKLFILILGIAAAAFALFPALTVDDTSYTGFEVIFGKSIASVGGFSEAKLLFSPFALMAYGLPLLAALIIVLWNNKLATLVSNILFLAAIVLLFTMTSYTKIEVNLFSTVSRVEVDWEMAYGLIGAAVASILGLLLSLFETYRALK